MEIEVIDIEAFLRAMAVPGSPSAIELIDRAERGEAVFTVTKRKVGGENITYIEPASYAYTPA